MASRTYQVRMADAIEEVQEALKSEDSIAEIIEIKARIHQVDEKQLISMFDRKAEKANG